MTDHAARAEARFARHVRDLRVAAGLSQREIAERMVELGHTGWLQSTVAKTEADKDRRPLRLDEFVSMCEVLDQVPGVTLTMVLGPRIKRDVVVAELRARIARAERDVLIAHERLDADTDELERLRGKLERLEADQ